MTHTDQAFINAYGRATSPTSPNPESVGVATGPHYAAGPSEPRFEGKAPLALIIAERMRQAAESVEPIAQVAAMAAGANPLAVEAAVHVARFAWPVVVDSLAELYGVEYRSLIDATRETTGVLAPVIAIAGVHSGSGSTTTTLAAARAAASETKPIAVVDANPLAAGLIEALGLVRTRSLADAAMQDRAIDALVHAAEDRITATLAAGSEPIAQSAIAKLTEASTLLRQTHEAVLIDVGSILDRRDQWTPGARLERLMSAIKPDGVLLVRSAEDLSGAVSAAHRVLIGAGARTLGVIENLVQSDE